MPKSKSSISFRYGWIQGLKLILRCLRSISGCCLFLSHGHFCLCWFYSQAGLALKMEKASQQAQLNIHDVYSPPPNPNSFLPTFLRLPLNGPNWVTWWSLSQSLSPRVWKFLIGQAIVTCPELMGGVRLTQITVIWGEGGVIFKEIWDCDQQRHPKQLMFPKTAE